MCPGKSGIRIAVSISSQRENLRQPSVSAGECGGRKEDQRKSSSLGETHLSRVATLSISENRDCKRSILDCLHFVCVCVFV